ncbi:hypothetical protein FQN50_008642 [Emmonsiellopsis sp. PD_5]|nr:hypothetical protein FQN50_008642 [Emmonsiellopsis sp. PD_5]
MSGFTFGFAGDDIDDQEIDIDEPNAGVSDGIQRLDIGHQHDRDQAFKREDEQGTLIEARCWDLDDMLSSLPSQISYNILPIPQPSHTNGPSQPINIPRREVFDIRAQLMAEDDTETNENAELISGLEKGDLKPTVYEGGFKTWECAVDLAKLLVAEEVEGVLSEDAEGDADVLELGAGTAIPSLSLLHALLSKPPPPHPPNRNLRFVFADYNAAVLRLVTVPNILLTWHTCRQQREQQEQKQQPQHDPQPQKTSDEPDTTEQDTPPDPHHQQPDIDIDPALLTTFRHDLQRRGISISLISGAWSPAFVELALSPNTLATTTTTGTTTNPSSPSLLILASETIYAPASLAPFAETLLALLRRRGGGVSGSNVDTKTKALIAAKKVYFGVGGGVDEFLEVMRGVGGGEGGFSVRERVDVRGEGVGRVVVEITV